ncbi:MAG: glycoside hydrolase family 19 protein [Spirochaetota bacterium]
MSLTSSDATLTEDVLIERLLEATAENYHSDADRFLPSYIKESYYHVKALLHACKIYGVHLAAEKAYVLATARRESSLGNTMHEQIDEEYANLNYADQIGNGDVASADGYYFRGRGYVQLTGRANYEDWGSRLGIDLLQNPERAIEPTIAAKICVIGMRDGTFTRKYKLSDFFAHDKTDFFAARNIVNPREVLRNSQLSKITEAYAESYHKVLVEF